jgi:hypothetical protein
VTAPHVPQQDALATVLAANPEQAEAAYSLGLLVAETGKMEEAAELMLRRAGEVEPSSYDALFALGDFLLRKGRFEDVRLIAQLARRYLRFGRFGQLTAACDPVYGGALGGMRRNDPSGLLRGGSDKGGSVNESSSCGPSALLGVDAYGRLFAPAREAVFPWGP